MVISLTSFPARLPSIGPCLASLVPQVRSDDRFVLWLGREQFPHGMDDVPMAIRSFSMDRGGCVEFRFTEDVKSFKKLLPALASFPDETIVTVDDDVAYAPFTIDILKKAHRQTPSAILSHAVSDLYVSRGEWCRTTGTYGLFSSWQPLRMMIGIGSVLYPPRCLDRMVADRRLFQRLCPTADDIWFWYCAAKVGTPILRVPGAISRPKMISATSIGALSATNESGGDQVNRDYIRRIRAFDPEFAALMDGVYRKFRFQIAMARGVRALVHYPRQAAYCLLHGGLGFLKAEIKRNRS